MPATCFACGSPDAAAGEKAEATLDLETRWVRASGGGKAKRLTLGASFRGLSSKARERLEAVLKLREFRPTIRFERVSASPRARRPKA